MQIPNQVPAPAFGREIPFCSSVPPSGMILALQGGSIMHKWTNDERMMIACCNDGTRPVIFKIERIDIPETEEEREWLEKQNFKNTAEDAYTG